MQMCHQCNVGNAVKIFFGFEGVKRTTCLIAGVSGLIIKCVLYAAFGAPALSWLIHNYVALVETRRVAYTHQVLSGDWELGLGQPHCDQNMNGHLPAVIYFVTLPSKYDSHCDLYPIFHHKELPLSPSQ